MRIYKPTSLPLDKFIERALYDKNSGYYMKIIHLERMEILLLHQISQDFFQK